MQHTPTLKSFRFLQWTLMSTVSFTIACNGPIDDEPTDDEPTDEVPVDELPVVKDLPDYPCRVDIDGMSDGTIDAVRTMTIEATARTVTQHVRHSGDSGPGSIRAFVHDNDGNVIRIVDDVDADGFADELTFNTFVDNRLLTTELNNNADSQIDVTSTHFYDDAGRLTSIVTVDAQAPTRNSITEFFHDDDDALFDRSVISTSSSGDVQKETRFSYDDRGNLVVEAMDLDSDGETDVFVTRDYDDQNRMIRLTQDLVSNELHKATFNYIFECE